jgi:hypothetical protein
MGLLSELLLFPITGPLRGLQFVLEQLLAEVEATYLDERRVEGELATLSLHHDLGQISGAEFEAKETALLEELDAIRAYKEALLEQYASEEAMVDDPQLYEYVDGSGP